MAKKESTFCKDWKQLARALGLDISPHSQKATARQLNKSQPLVAEFIASSFCPKKNPPKKGWRVDEITPAFHQFLNSHKGTQKPQSKGEQKDLPQRRGDAEGKDLFLNLTEEEQQEAYRAKLQKNLRIFLGLEVSLYPLRKFEIDELRENNLIPEMQSSKPSVGVAPSGAVHQIEDLCDSYADIAGKLDAYYRSADGSSRLQFEINAQAVSDWKKGKRLPSGAPPPPGKCNSRQWSLKQWIDWFDRWLWLEWKLADNGQTEAFGDADLRRMKIQEERDQILHNQFQRDIERGQYVAFDIAQRAVSGMATMLFNEMRARIEKMLPAWGINQGKALLKLSEEQAQELSSALREEGTALVDGLHRWCGDKSKELEAGLATDEHR